MRKLLGGLALVAGVGGLGYWGAKDHAVDMEAAIGGLSVAAVAQSVHAVDTKVEGRDITVSGYADTEAERETLLAALHEVRGRRVVRDDLVVLPVADPYVFEAERAQGETRLSGSVPTVAAQQALVALGGTVETLPLASGAPDGWATAAGAAAGALMPLSAGVVSLTGTDLILTGTAATPVEENAARAALVGLPDGYTQDVQINVIDDGIPDFEMSYDASAGAILGGKLPAGLDALSVGKSLGVSVVEGDVITSIGTDAGAATDLAALSDWLPEFDFLNLSRKGGVTSVSGQVMPGVDGELVQAGLSDGLNGAAVELSQSSRTPDNGATRTNARTGLNEVFTAGFWLPQITFEPSLEACDGQARGVLEASKINFVIGSARLSARSVRSVNALASVVGTCVNDGGLTLELGGHTDSTGNPEANMALSTERAEAVRSALLARGIKEDAIIATGFGASQPIADNETEDGRAANRRTTITWSN